MATYSGGSGTKTFSGSGSIIQNMALADIYSIVSEIIPKYSTINDVTLKVYIRETSNKVGNADFYVFFGDNSNNSVHQLYYGNGKIPKNDKSDLEVSLNLKDWTSSDTSNAGNISYSGATRLCFRCQSSLISRNYQLSFVIEYDYTLPTFTIKTVAGTGGKVTDTATYDVTIADQTKQITATPNAGYKFVKWTDSNGKTYTDDDTISVIISQNSISAHSTTVTYTAEFAPITYTVKFVNYDGTVLQSSSASHGSTPSYTGATPTKPQDVQNTYSFNGWSPTIGAVTSNITYTAQFKATLRKYTVRWFNEDGTLLETDITEYGKMPVYDGTTPVKPATAQYTYTFAGWHIEISEVKGDIDYIATYASTVNTYTVIWKNSDGTVLETDEKVPYGDIPEYNGATPTQPSTAQYSFTFANWDTAVVEVTKDIIYTAVYTKSINKYTIQISSVDDSRGTVTGDISGKYDYGTILILNAIAKNGYEFTEWIISNNTQDIVFTDSSVIIKVVGDENIQAQFLPVNYIRIGTSKPLGIYYTEETKTVTFVIEEDVTVGPTGADTVDGLHLSVSNKVPEGAIEVIGCQVGKTYLYKSV